jgi:hypothetical protein
MCKRNTGTRVDGVDTLGHVSIKIRPYAHAFRSLYLGHGIMWAASPATKRVLSCCLKAQTHSEFV